MSLKTKIYHPENISLWGYFSSSPERKGASSILLTSTTLAIVLTMDIKSLNLEVFEGKQKQVWLSSYDE